MVGVSFHHPELPVPHQILDEVDVFPRHRQPAPECVPGVMKMEVPYFGFFQRDGESPLKIPVANPGPVLRGKDKVGTEIPHFLIAGLSLEWMRRVLPYPGVNFS